MLINKSSNFDVFDVLGSNTFSFSWSSHAGSSFSAASLFLFFNAACRAAPAAFHCALRRRPWTVLGIFWSAREEGQQIGMIRHVIHLFTEIQQCRENTRKFYTFRVSTTSALEVATGTPLSLEGSGLVVTYQTNACQICLADATCTRSYPRD